MHQNGMGHFFAVAAGLAGALLVAAAFVVAFRARRAAVAGEVALIELQGKVADRIGLDSFRMMRDVQ